MKKTIKLTEGELRRLVEGAINEVNDTQSVYDSSDFARNSFLDYDGKYTDKTYSEYKPYDEESEQERRSRIGRNKSDERIINRWANSPTHPPKWGAPGPYQYDKLKYREHLANSRNQEYDENKEYIEYYQNKISELEAEDPSLKELDMSTINRISNNAKYASMYLDDLKRKCGSDEAIANDPNAIHAINDINKYNKYRDYLYFVNQLKLFSRGVNRLQQKIKDDIKSNINSKSENESRSRLTNRITESIIRRLKR